MRTIFRFHVETTSNTGRTVNSTIVRYALAPTLRQPCATLVPRREIILSLSGSLATRRGLFPQPHSIGSPMSSRRSAAS